MGLPWGCLESTYPWWSMGDPWRVRAGPWVAADGSPTGHPRIADGSSTGRQRIALGSRMGRAWVAHTLSMGVPWV